MEGSQLLASEMEAVERAEDLKWYSIVFRHYTSIILGDVISVKMSPEMWWQVSYLKILDIITSHDIKGKYISEDVFCKVNPRRYFTLKVIWVYSQIWSKTAGFGCFLALGPLNILGWVPNH